MTTKGTGMESRSRGGGYGGEGEDGGYAKGGWESGRGLVLEEKRDRKDTGKFEGTKSVELRKLPGSLPAWASTFILRGSNVSTLRRGAFSPNGTELPLVTVSLAHNGIRAIEPYAFWGLARLHLLDLSHNRLASVSPGSFYGLRELRSLNFNRSVSPSAGALLLDALDGARHLRSLHRLDLAGNGLTAVPTLRRHMASLHTLVLTNNSIETVDGDAVAALYRHGRVRVYMSLNPFRCDCALEPFYEWLRNASQCADAGGLVCSEPEARRGARLEDLGDAEVDCASENLETVSYVFLGLVLALIGVVFLMVLYLNRGGMKRWLNNLREACRDQMELPGSLPAWASTFILRGSNVSTLRRGAFSPNGTELPLVTVSLAHNGIRAIEPYAFWGLARLHLLDLSHNRLASVSPGSFYGLRELRSLNFNRSVSPSAGALLVNALDGARHLRSLHRLDLAGNGLTAVPTLRRHMASLHTLVLTNNSIETVDGDAVAALYRHGRVRVYMSLNPFRCDCALEPFYEWLRNASQCADAGGLVCSEPEARRGARLEDLGDAEVDCASENLETVSYVFLGLVLALIGVVFLMVLYLNRGGMKRWLNNLREACRDQMEVYHYRYEQDSDPRLANLRSLNFNRSVLQPSATGAGALLVNALDGARHLRSLHRLDLAGNGLTAVPTLRRHMASLHTLVLTNNSIETVDGDAVAALYRHGRVRVYMSLNPFRCDCALEPFYDAPDAGGLVCSEPEARRGARLEDLGDAEVDCASENLETVSYVFLGLVLALIGVVFLMVLYLNRGGMKRWLNNLREACRDQMEYNAHFAVMNKF
ncbi:hypothetical protein CRUP_016419 [Coryphaenoides rupestris]|nr:hypothetical protein CRUP_016419 [Coryphaenoides rupestris]